MRGLGFTNLDPHDRPRGARPRRARRRHPRRDEHHGRAGRRLGARRQRRRDAHRRPERLPHDRPRRAARPRSRSTCTGCSTAGRSGTRWSTTCPPTSCGPLVRAKVDSQLARAMRYVEAVGARAVVPSAGPPCFLDPELFHLNVIDGDEPSIFVDQRVFLERLGDSGHHGVLAVPGTTIDVTPDDIAVAPPRSGRRCDAHASPTSASTSSATRPTGCRGSTTLKAGWKDHDERRPDRRPAGVVAPAAGDGADAAGRRRRVVPAAGRRRGRADRLPRRRGPSVRRRGRALPVRDRAGARRVRRRRQGRRLEQLAVPVLPLPGVARRGVQRVGLQLLQVAVRRADAPHGGRGRPPPRPARRDRARHRARRLGRAAALPTPQRRPGRVRRGRGRHADVHAARLALRPRDRPLPHVRRPPLRVRRRDR